MKWILIVLWYADAPLIDKTSFDTEANCLAAMSIINNLDQNEYRNITRRYLPVARCIEK